MIENNMNWNLLDLGRYNGTITKELVEQKYQMQLEILEDKKRRILERSDNGRDMKNKHLQQIEGFMAGLNNAYQYCIDDMNIAIRNKILSLSVKPNAALSVKTAEEEPAKITSIRKDIRELGYLRNSELMQQLLASKDFNCDVLVPPDQPEKEIYYDIATGELLSERKTETTILLARRINKVVDGQFSIIRRAIYNITDKATSQKHTQLTEYEVRRRKAKSITEESTLLYGEINMEKLQKDPEYRAGFYKAFERAGIRENPYIGRLTSDVQVLEESLEKNIARKLRKMELGEYDKEETISYDETKKTESIREDR